MHDAIVIGGGIGGLSAAARLAREGRSVLLLEQHDRLGGFASTFRRKGAEMEVALHFLSGLDDPEVEEFFSQLDLRKDLDLFRIPGFYRCVHRHAGGSSDVSLPGDAEAAAEILIARYPGEERGIREYFRVLRKIEVELNRLIARRAPMDPRDPSWPILFPFLARYRGRTVGDFLAETVQSEDLRVILSATIGFFHDDPWETCLVSFAKTQSSLFHGGGHYLRGGSQALSDLIGSRIRGYGGEILLRHVVTEILVEDGRAIGVKYRGVRDPAGSEKTAYAGAVIANAAVPQVFRTLLPGYREHKFTRLLEQRRPSCTMSILYLFLARPASVFGSRDYHLEYIESRVDAEGRFRFDEIFAFVDLSQLDSGLAPAGKGLATLLVRDEHRRWAGLSDEAYRMQKEALAAKYLARLDSLFPGIASHVERCEVATPLTVERYTLNPGGSIYGYAMIPGQTNHDQLGPQSVVPGLYLASAWASGHGVDSVIRGGMTAARLILNRQG